MAKDSPKYIDIKAPEKTTPSSSSRPLLVTNRSLIGDPMVNTDDPSAEDKPAESIALARTAKTINPVSADLAEPATDETAASAETPAAKELKQTEPVPEAETKAEPELKDETPVPPEAPKPAEPTPKDTEDTAVADAPQPTNRDAAAESTADAAKAAAEAEAKAAREAELEQLIESGKYKAPINAVQRKRSRLVAVLLCLIALLLGVAVLDAALDAGLLKADGVPHTNYLKK
jgi:hypothetical protein